jgi:hypothetical protein
MIIIMSKNATPLQIEEVIRNLISLGLDACRAHCGGGKTTVLTVLGHGPSQATTQIKSLPGVERVVRVSEHYDTG